MENDAFYIMFSDFHLIDVFRKLNIEITTILRLLNSLSIREPKRRYGLKKSARLLRSHISYIFTYNGIFIPCMPLGPAWSQSEIFQKIWSAVFMRWMWDSRLLTCIHIYWGTLNRLKILHGRKSRKCIFYTFITHISNELFKNL